MNNHPISITHKNGKAVAVAGDVSRIESLGIDLESLTLDDNLEDLILSTAERQYIPRISEEDRIYYIKRLWSAKEAAAKSLGLALVDCLTKLSIADNIHGKNKFNIHLHDL